MIGCLRGCIVLVVLIVIGGAVAWFAGPEILDRVDDWRGSATEVEAEPSPELGAAALERLRAAAVGEIPEARFTGPELESILRFELAGQLPPGFSEPTVELTEGEARVEVRVEKERIPRLPEIEQLRELFPDTVPVRLHGRVIAIDSGDAGFVVRRVDAAGVPIPSRFFPAVVELLDLGASGDLPPEILRIPLPEGIHSVRIDGRELVVNGTP